MRQYVPIDTQNLPDVFEIDVGGNTYFWRVDYNEVADYYTVTIALGDQVLLSGEPMLINNIIGYDIPNPLLPLDDIRVMDESGKVVDAGLIAFGDSVQAYIDEIDPNGSETINPDATPLGYDPDEEDEENDAEGTIII